MLLLALLAALAVLLRLGENLLPLPVQLGGARPGLANTLTILCLYLFGLRLTGLFLTVRILLVGLLSTGLFTPGFCIGLGGTLFSLLLMEAGRRSQLFSPCGIGILGAAAHNTGQILTAAALALTASVRSSSSETRTAPVRLPICFKDFVIFKNRPFQPQRRLCAFQNGTRRNLSPQK